MSHSLQSSHVHHADAQHITFARKLRELGLRVTPQRVFVLETLSSGSGHMTADDVMQRIVARYPSINLATIYRTLDTLVSAGLVSQTDLGNGPSAFELVGDAPHHHLVCSRCGAITEVADALLVPMRERLLHDYNFRADALHMAIFGTCSACLRTNEANANLSISSNSSSQGSTTSSTTD